MTATPYSTPYGIVFRNEKGQIMKGSAGGPGRKRGIDFRRLVIERHEKMGESLEDALWGVYLRLLRITLDDKSDDQSVITASRLLIERLTDPIPKHLHIDHTAEGRGGPPVPTGRDFGRELMAVYRIAEKRGMLPEDEDDLDDVLGEE